MSYTIDDVLGLARTFKGFRVDVAEELKRLEVERLPVAYPYGFKLSVADVAIGFRDALRLVYMKYALKAVRGRSGGFVGLLIHAVFAGLWRQLRR